jgi:S-DNA-T family DNA segregation ATPase FtsK/SpoIIIE
VALPRLDGRDGTDGLTDAQDEALAKAAAAWQGPGAPPVRMLPDRVSAAELALPEGASRPGVPIGLAETDLGPVHLDLTAADPHFLVFGDSGSGKSAFLRTWMTGLAARRTAWEARFIVVDYRRSLLGVVPQEHLGAYAGDSTAAEAYAQQVAAKLTERLPPANVTPQQLRALDWWQGPDFYVVVDDYDLVSNGRQSPLAPLVAFLPQARELGLHVVLARRVAGLTRIGATDPLLSRIQEMGADGLILSGDPREGVLLGAQRAAPRPPGRGVLVRRKSSPLLIQAAYDE